MVLYDVLSVKTVNLKTVDIVARLQFIFNKKGSIVCGSLMK